MLQTFTKEDHLRERNRCHEEWLRVQRTEENRIQKLLKLCQNEKKAKEDALDALQMIQMERQAAEQERQAKDEAVRAEEAALQKSAEIQRRTILALKKASISNNEIAESLDISLVQVEETV